MTAFLAADRSVAVDLDDQAIESMRALCVKSARLETGGVVIGRYNEFGDRVVVSKVSGPPRDSRRSAFSFIRGVAGLTNRLRVDWRDGLYYVGEWHFHPFAAPKPSGTDLKQIKAFARTADLRCSRPVIVILGGNPADRWSLRVAIVTDGAVMDLEQVPAEADVRVAVG